MHARTQLHKEIILKSAHLKYLGRNVLLKKDVFQKLFDFNERIRSLTFLF